MTGFFHRMAARAAGTEVALAPPPRSRFQPDTTPALDDWASATVREAVERVSPDRDAGPAPPAGAAGGGAERRADTADRDPSHRSTATPARWPPPPTPTDRAGTGGPASEPGTVSGAAGFDTADRAPQARLAGRTRRPGPARPAAVPPATAVPPDPAVEQAREADVIRRPAPRRAGRSGVVPPAPAVPLVDQTPPGDAAALGQAIRGVPRRREAARVERDTAADHGPPVTTRESGTGTPERGPAADHGPPTTTGEGETVTPGPGTPAVRSQHVSALESAARTPKRAPAMVHSPPVSAGDAGNGTPQPVPPPSAAQAPADVDTAALLRDHVLPVLARRGLTAPGRPVDLAMPGKEPTRRSPAGTVVRPGPATIGQAPAGSGPPTVEVHIGRIEVVAGRSEPRAPRPDLAGYLRRRRERPR
jgi:hypothetical protein